MVVTSEHNGRGNLTSCNSIIKSLRNLGAPLAVGIQDSRLRTHNKLVFFSFLYPMQVILKLPFYIIRSIFEHLLQNLCRQTVGHSQVVRITRRAHPPERPETVIEKQRTHNILNIRRITERTIRLHNICTSP